MKIDKSIWYHISNHYLGKTATLTPRVPKYCNISEEGDIPRICVSNNIKNCMYGVLGVDDITGDDIFEAFSVSMKSNKETNRRLQQIKKLNFIKDAYSYDSLEFNDSYDITLYCSHYPSNKEVQFILDDLCDVASVIEFFPNKKGQFEKISFACFKNPSVYTTKEKAYLPPNASDFRQNEEHWILKPTEFKYMGKINLAKLIFTKGDCFSLCHKDFSCCRKDLLKNGISF